MNKYNIMRRKSDGLFFIKMRPNTGFGDLMTIDPNKATLYTNTCPPGFVHDKNLWESVDVEVNITLNNKTKG